eukprot:1724367-Prymnesium_polylepis.3
MAREDERLRFVSQEVLAVLARASGLAVVVVIIGRRAVLEDIVHCGEFRWYRLMTVLHIAGAQLCPHASPVYPASQYRVRGL